MEANIQNWLSSKMLKPLKQLPNPLIKRDGTELTSKTDWEQQRAYLKEMLSHYIYGHLPPKPEAVTGKRISAASVYEEKAIEEIYEIEINHTKELSFRIRVVRPQAGERLPSIFRCESNEMNPCPYEEDIVTKHRYLIVTVNAFAIVPDDPLKESALFKQVPEYDWGTIAAWGWVVMRALDFVETLDLLDPEKICVTGHSRCGKAALAAGIYDERFAITVPNGSGCGGAGCLRYIGGHGGLSQNPRECETVGCITSAFPHWYVKKFAQFGTKTEPHVIDQEFRLPFDANTIRAVLAPRAILSVEGLFDEWSNPCGTQICWQAAQSVFDFLGVGEKNAIYTRNGVHEQDAEAWQVLVEYCDFLFFGKPVTLQLNNRKFDIKPESALEMI